MTRDEVITELKARIKKQFQEPRGLEGTTQAKLIVADNAIHISEFVYSNANELLKLCTDYWGDKFLERIDKEITPLYMEEVNKLFKIHNMPKIDFNDLRRIEEY